MRQRRNHSPLTLLVIIAMMVGSVCAQAQLPVRTRQVQLFSNNNTNYTILRSADGQTTNWSLIQPPTVGTTGSLQLSTVGGSDAQLSWLAPGAAGYMLGISAGIPAWVDPATYLNGSFWSVLGNAGTNPATNFIGTTDAQPLVFRTNNTETGRFLSTGELQLASIAGAVNATVPVGYDRFLVADASGNVDQVEYAAVINQNAWSLLGNAGTNAATNYLGTSDAQPLVVRTNATERLRVNATGEVGIGTTATAGYLLHVNGTAGTPNVRLTSISGVAAASVPAGFDRIMLANSTGDVGEASTSAVIGAAAWTLLGNTGTNPATNFIGTTDAQPLVFRTNNTETGRFLSTGELQLASIAGAVNATVPVGYDRFLVADASGNVDQVEYAAVINQNAWSLLGNAGTNAATNYLGTSDAQPLVVRTNATERLRVNATGEVGIGTTAPAGYLLHVNGTAGTPNVRLTSISGVAAASVPAGFDRIMLANSTGDVGEASTAAVIGTAAWTLFGNTGTNPATNFIGTTDAQPLVFRTNNTEAGRFLSTGELQLASIAGAVNATVPVGYDRFLVADASGNVDQVEYAAVINQNAWSLLGNAGTNAATNYLGTSDAQPLVVRTNATERLRVNATGEVGIGTTATAGYLLHVNGTAGTPNVRLTSISGVAAASVPAGFDRIMLANSTGDVSEASTSAVIGAAAWTLLGNSGTNPATNFIGTTDAQPLVFRTNNTEAGRFLSTGELQLASIAGAVNVAVPAGYDRFLIADASGNVDQVEYAAVINQNAWSLLGNAGTNAATNYLGTSDAQPLVVRTNATERLRVNATGEVGIGTTATAGYLLHVNGTAGTPNVRLTSISGVAAASVPAGFDRIMLANSTGDVSEASTSAVIGAAAWTLLGNSGTNPATNYLGTTDAQPLVVRTNATERLRVNATGEVGIGTTATAGYLLEVTGTAGTPNVRLTSVSGAAAVAIPAGFDRVILSNATGDLSQASTSAVVGTTAWTLLGNSGTNPATNYLGTSDAQPLVIRTNATEVARFNSTGEFGLGTTAAAGYRLHVAGTGGTENVRMGSLSAASADPIVAGSEGIVTADNNGDLRRRSAADMFTVLGIGRGIYTPAVSGSSFVIPTTGLDLQAGAVINVTVVGPSAPAVHAMVTATDAAGNTITVGTSATIGPTYSIHWMIINP